MSEKPEEVFAIAEPWSCPSTGGKLESVSRLWVPEHACWFLLGGIRYPEDHVSGDYGEERISVNIPEGRHTLLPGELFIRQQDHMAPMYKYLTESGILKPTGKTFRSGFVDFPVCSFHKEKCAPRFKCDQCDKIADSTQAYYDERVGKTFCMVCEAILHGDIDAEPLFGIEGEAMINKFDELEL